LVTVDRPGFGLSDHQPARRILDFASDVAELANELRWGRFSVVGASAGGAYALACGFALADRLEHVVLANTMVPLELPGVPECFDPSRRFGYWLVGHVPGQARWVAWLQQRALVSEPEALLERVSSGMSSTDRQAVGDPAASSRLTAHLAEAYRQGSAGVAHELQLLSRPWGFALGAISTGVSLIHGELDANVPVAAARIVATALPRCRATFLPGEGHLSGPVAQEAIVAALGTGRELY
jgi:pimeloyl-ACP methyl ester carboxylesterase